MPKVGYIGSSNLSKKIKKGYIGVNNSAKKIKKVYLGVNGKSKLVWNSENVIFVSVKQFYNRSGNGYYSIEDDGDTLRYGLYAGTYDLDSFELNNIDLSDVPLDKRTLLYDTKYVYEHTLVGVIPQAKLHFIVKKDSLSYRSGNYDIEGEPYQPKYDNSWNFITSSDEPNTLQLSFIGDIGSVSTDPEMRIGVSITNLRFADGTKIKFVEE